MRHLLLIIASVHTRTADHDLEIDQHRVLVQLCRARNIEAAMACLEKDLLSSKNFALKHTYEAQRDLKRSDRSPWQEKTPLGISLRAAAGPGKAYNK